MITHRMKVTHMTLRQRLTTSAFALLAATGLGAVGAGAAQAADAHMGGTLKLVSAAAAGTVDSAARPRASTSLNHLEMMA